MYPYPPHRPLETLSAFALVLAVGITATLVLNKYIDVVRRKAVESREET